MLFDSILFIVALLSKLNCISGTRETQQEGEWQWNRWSVDQSEYTQHLSTNFATLHGCGSWHPQNNYNSRIKSQSESEVAQLCPTLCDPMDCKK